LGDITGYLLPVAPLIFLLLERPLGLVSKVTGYLDSLWVFRKGFSLYNLISYFILIGMWAFMLMYIPQVLSEYSNPILANYLNGHWLSWLGLLCVVTVFGHFDIIKGVYAGAFVYCIHELTWVVFDAINIGQYSGSSYTICRWKHS